MSRIDELQKKYPTLAREVIIKQVLHRGGVRHSQTLDKVSLWSRLAGYGTYQSYDRDVTLKTVAETTSGSLRPGYIKRLGSFHMKNGLGVRIDRDSTSAYVVREEPSGRFALYEGEEKVEEIFFLRRPLPFDERDEPVTRKGKPVTSLVSLKGPNCYSINPVRYCEYFATGDQCKFCNYNSTQDDARSVGLARPVTVNLEEVADAFTILSSNTRLYEGQFIMGGFKDGEQEATVHLQFVEKIAGAASYSTNINVSTQPMSRKNIQRLKDVGANCLSFYPEVWDPQLFAGVCPGKAKHTSFERYKEAFLETAEIFGAGNVGGILVGGVTMMPSNGHKTWQESRDCLIKGLRWAINNGIFLVFLSLRLGPGSIYGDDKANREKLPPDEYFLDATVAHNQAMKEYGLYAKLNKLMVCPLCCMDGHYSGEAGILELAGNPGNWLADTIPDEENWVAQFVSSIKAPSRV